MRSIVIAILLGSYVLSAPALSAPDVSLTLDDEQMQKAKGIYQTYCTFCHAEDRSGYRADNAPSLRSKSLLSTGYPGFIIPKLVMLLE